MIGPESEDNVLQSVALQNARSILQARMRMEDDLRVARHALEQSNLHISRILESITDGLIVVDEEWRFTYLNKKAQEILRPSSASSSKISGYTFWEAFPDLEGTTLEQTYRHAMEERVAAEFEVLYAPLNRWLDIRVYPFDKGVSIYFQDVSRRKNAEIALRQSEEDLRTLADSIPQLAWMAHPDGYVFWYNRGWYEYTGTTSEQMEGWGWQSVHDPAMLPMVMERWQESIRTGQPFELEFPLRSARGDYRWFLTRVNPVRDSTGQVKRWFGTNTDVDQVNRIRKALEDQTRILELLNETGTRLSTTLDLQALMQAVTDAATKLSGASMGAFFYNNVDHQGNTFVLHTLSGVERGDFLDFGQPRATALFGPIFSGEGSIRCDDVHEDPRYGAIAPHHGLPQGHPAVRSFLAVPVVSRTGEVIGGLFFGHPQVGIFTARTERTIAGVAAQTAVAIDNARLYEAAQKSAEERKQLLESERFARAEAERMSDMKDEFLATLSHELRTPLSAILGWSHILKRGVKSETDLQRGLDIIERNARVQTQLIEDLLDMSRIAAGKVRLDVQPIQPVAFVEAAIETVRPAADAKGIRIVKVLDPAAGPISGDPGRLQQIVWNLLSNAIKFTPKEGMVQVLLESVSSHVEISVADTGIGIDPEFLPHVFERFRQGDASTTRKFGGLGLGLSIAKDLVELHGGTVEAKSDGAGRGATFVVHLPLVVVHSRSHEAPRVHPKSPTLAAFDLNPLELSGVKVLIVDDEADARELVRRVLTACGAQVFTAATAAQALEIIASDHPQVLISDIGMPDVDGFELLRRVRALGDAGGGGIPAIALTAFARSEDRTRALRAGFLVHVSKPVEPSELAATVATVAGRTGQTATVDPVGPDR